MHWGYLRSVTEKLLTGTWVIQRQLHPPKDHPSMGAAHRRLNLQSPIGKSASWISLAIAATLTTLQRVHLDFATFRIFLSLVRFFYSLGLVCFFYFLSLMTLPPSPRREHFNWEENSHTVVRSEQKTSSWQVLPSLLSRSYVSSRANLSIVS